MFLAALYAKVEDWYSVRKCIKLCLQRPDFKKISASKGARPPEDPYIEK